MPPDPRDEERASAAIWKAWQEAGHMARGCEGWTQGFLAGEVVCACGEVVPMPEGTAAA